MSRKYQQSQQSKRDKGGDDEGGAPAWMVTYGDFVTLVLTFFVLLFSMSTLDPEKPIQITNEIRKRIGEPVKVQAPTTDVVQAFRMNPVRYQPTATDVRSFEGTEAAVESVEEGLKVQIKNKVMFDQGSYRLKDDPSLKKSLDGIIDFLEDSNNRIEIRGFTSPMQGDILQGDLSFQSFDEKRKWSEKIQNKNEGKHLLAYLRAQSVYRYFIKKVPVVRGESNENSQMEPRIDPARIRISSEGDNNPEYLGQNQDLMANNRRVEIIVLEKLIHN